MPIKTCLPEVERCCYCVTDLKTAVALIVVIAIVTNPVISWIAVRHSYAIRMACTYTQNHSRMDIIDLDFKNVVTFGFGVNAGLETSCFKHGATTEKPPIAQRRQEATESKDTDINLTVDQKTYTSEEKNTKKALIMWFGWLLMVVDLVYLCLAFILLVKLFQGAESNILKYFMIAATVSTMLSFIYGLFYIIICFVTNKSFAFYEMFFICIDLAVWCYFLLVANTYRRRLVSPN